MTKQQFESHGFSIGTKIEYKGEAYHLLSVDFDTGYLEISKIPLKSDVFIDDEDRISVPYYACDIIHA